jgi:alanine racemase
MITRTRPVWAEISRSRLIANHRAVLEEAGHQSSSGAAGLLAVVKANAYGHGSPQCAPILVEAGAEWLGVTSVDEGVVVRAACKAAWQNISPSILVMCSLWQGEAAAVIDNKLTPMVWEPYHLDLLEEEARRRGLAAGTVSVHLEIDTGMSRQGVTPGAQLAAVLPRFQKSPLRLAGLMMHFASAEVADAKLNAEQMRRFTAAVEQVAAAGLRPQWISAGNSSTVDASVELPGVSALAARFGARSMPRPGLALYGYCMPVEAGGSVHRGALAPKLQPVLTWKTRVVAIREVEAGTTVGYSATFTAAHKMRLALLPVGYADGYRREFSNAGHALVRGQRAPITGRVSMDLTIVDVTEIAGVEIGDEVVLLGEQGAERIGADELARIAGTIPYEVLCGISDRVPRRVVE